MPLSLLYAGEGEKISIYQRNAMGGLSRDGSAATPGFVRGFCFSPDRYRLFVATTFGKEGKNGAITTFKVDQVSGSLAQVGATVSLDYTPALVTTDRSGRFLLFACYKEPGSCGVLEINAGVVQPGLVSRHDDLPDSSHFIGVDPTNAYAFVPSVAAINTSGGNAITQYKFDSTTGELTPNGVLIPPPTGPWGAGPRFGGPALGSYWGGNAPASPPYSRFGTRPEAGPRHFVWHPWLPVMYTANEQGNSVTAYSLDYQTGQLALLGSLSTVPDDFYGTSHCAEIKMDPEGWYLYAPNRGHDSVAVFAVDRESGKLNARASLCMVAEVAQLTSDPDTAVDEESGEPARFSPQHLAIDPSGQTLYHQSYQEGWIFQ